MVHALTGHVRNTFCGQYRRAAQRARPGPGLEPDQAAQQPRAQPPAPNAAHQPAQRRFIGRFRQHAAPHPPHGCGLERLPPPLPPSLQRRRRDRPPARDRPKARPGCREQRADHHEQGGHPETAAEEPNRRWRDPAPAGGAAETEPARAASQLRRQTVRLAGVRGAVKHPSAVWATRQAAGRRLCFVDAFEQRPGTGIGKVGTGEQIVLHWTLSRLKSLSPRKTSRRTCCKCSGGSTHFNHHSIRASRPRVPSARVYAFNRLRIGAMLRSIAGVKLRFSGTQFEAL